MRVKTTGTQHRQYCLLRSNIQPVKSGESSQISSSQVTLLVMVPGGSHSIAIVLLKEKCVQVCLHNDLIYPMGCSALRLLWCSAKYTNSQ